MLPSHSKSQGEKRQRDSLGSTTSTTIKTKRLKQESNSTTRKAIQLIRTRLYSRFADSQTKKRIKEKIRGNFLNKVCYSSGECLAFGNEVETVRQFFHNYTTKEAFQLIQETINLNKGGNGTIQQIKYTKKVDNIEYNAFAILKMPNSSSSDNLAYEYLVGKQFINPMMKYFPCFVETYGLFNQPEYVFLAKSASQYQFPLNPNKKLNEKLFKGFIKTICQNSSSLCLLIQHLQNPRTFSAQFIKTQTLSFDILFVLLQVYYPLSEMNTNNLKFTHYDLHGSNVLLYIPDEDGYIEYHYHYTFNNQDHIIHFKSKYLAKIIDYGRCYFYKDQEYNTPKIYDAVCKTKECNKPKDSLNNNAGIDCGHRYGFGTFSEYMNNTHKVYSKKGNISSDLNLITAVKETFENAIIDNNDKPILYLLRLLDKVQFDSQHFGTDEKSFSVKDEINNVRDAYSYLKELALDPISKKQNDLDYDATKRKIGDLHVYGIGRECTFTPYKAVSTGNTMTTRF